MAANHQANDQVPMAAPNLIAAIPPGAPDSAPQKKHRTNDHERRSLRSGSSALRRLRRATRRPTTFPRHGRAQVPSGGGEGGQKAPRTDKLLVVTQAPPSLRRKGRCERSEPGEVG